MAVYGHQPCTGTHAWTTAAVYFACIGRSWPCVCASCFGSRLTGLAGRVHRQSSPELCQLSPHCTSRADCRRWRVVGCSPLLRQWAPRPTFCSCSMGPRCACPPARPPPRPRFATPARSAAAHAWRFDRASARDPALPALCSPTHSPLALAQIVVPRGREAAAVRMRRPAAGGVRAAAARMVGLDGTQGAPGRAVRRLGAADSESQDTCFFSFLAVY